MINGGIFAILHDHLKFKKYVCIGFHLTELKVKESLYQMVKKNLKKKKLTYSASKHIPETWIYSYELK